MFLYHHLNNLPEFFKDYFVTNNQIHQYNTRNASKLHKCYKRTNYVEHTLSNKGVDVWNSHAVHQGRSDGGGREGGECNTPP